MLHEMSFENCTHSRDPLTSCALEGVVNITAGIRDVGVVIHSPQGCSSTVANAYDLHEIDFTKRKIGCSRLFEKDIIMGATEKLKGLILQADQTYQTEVLFVIGTCAADIIGEDLEAVCRAMQDQVKALLIPVMAGGFRGDSYDGMEQGLSILLGLIRDKETALFNPEKPVFNLIAPQASINPSWRADVSWVSSVIEEMGGSVGASLAHQISLDELTMAGQASASLMLTHDAGLKFAKGLEKKGVPLLMEDRLLPLGMENTSRWLRALGEYLNAGEIAERIIQEGEAHVVGILRKRGLMIIPRYRNCRIAVSADCTLGIPLVRTLYRELEMIPELLLFRGDSPQARKLLEQELDELGIQPKVVFAADGWKIQEALRTVSVDAVIGSAWEKYIAEELNIPYAFDVFQPTNRDIYIDRPYFGYEGFLNLLEVIANDWEHALRSKRIEWEQFVR